jgi:hypothetical protein
VMVKKNNFLKNKKYYFVAFSNKKTLWKATVILMYFQAKNTLKSNQYRIPVSKNHLNPII